MLPVFSRWCTRYAANFTVVGAAFRTTARVNAARFQPLVYALCCPLYCCWCRLLHYGEGKCCPFFSRWCRRHAAHFTSVGAAFYTTARINAAFFSRWCRRYAPHFTAVGADFYTTAWVNAARFSAVGVGVMLPTLLLLVPPFTLRRR